LVCSDNNLCGTLRGSWKKPTRAGNVQAVSQWPCYAVALKRTAWSEHGMASVNQTWPHCVNQMGKTHSKPLAAWHGMVMAWAWHAMCESANSDPHPASTSPNHFHHLEFEKILLNTLQKNI
jgi:hypothetical protein